MAFWRIHLIKVVLAVFMPLLWGRLGWSAENPIVPRVIKGFATTHSGTPVAGVVLYLLDLPPSQIKGG
ncbi:MAG: hypothetical protein JO316_07665 [Abitibacteriaceae bacterium]|nr:hypothetical protein [Abditibacteriaceae bacterium]